MTGYDHGNAGLHVYNGLDGRESDQGTTYLNGVSMMSSKNGAEVKGTPVGVSFNYKNRLMRMSNG
jgi:hypothetical protein